MDYKVFDADDFGIDHIISDMCQSHDCRDMLNQLKAVNPNFKATLFTIPAYVTMELLMWASSNADWIELAVHGFDHNSNYECEKWTYEQMDAAMSLVANFGAFTKGFKAPGWQISDGCLQWLSDKGWWVADKNYNNDRRPKYLRAYVNYDGNDMRVHHNGKVSEIIPASHHHTWNCVGNGVYEQSEYLIELVKETKDWKFVSEVIRENS